MLFFILFGAITIIGIILLVIFLVKDMLDELLTIIPTTLMIIFGGVPLVTCGILAGIENSSVHYYAIEAELTETVDSLNSTYNRLITDVDNESVKISIQQYNQEVKEFKSLIRTRRQQNKNLWMNAFTNNIYNEARFNPDVVSYI